MSTTNKLPNYLGAIVAIGDRCRPGTVTRLQVAHDSTCAHWKGKPCDCSPEVHVVSITTTGRQAATKE